MVQAYIERIKQVNSCLNAVVQDRFEDALKDAEHADSLIAKADDDVKLLLLFQRYPLLGIPFTVKESCGLKGRYLIFYKILVFAKYLSIVDLRDGLL